MKVRIREIRPPRQGRSRTSAILMAVALLVPGFILNLKAALFFLLIIALAAVMETRAARLRNLSYNVLLPYLLIMALGGLSCAEVLTLMIEWLGRQPLAILLFILAAPVLLLMFMLILSSGFVLIFSAKVILTSLARGRLLELWQEFGRAGVVKKVLMMAVVAGFVVGVCLYAFWLVIT